MPTAREHPSNILYRGEARDLAHGLELVLAETAAERRYDRAFAAEARAVGEEWPREMSGALDEFEGRAERARGIAACGRDREATVAALRAAGLDEFADALASGDYSGLAI